MGVKLPNNEQRITLIGRTGTGKTQAALWHLSNFSFAMPWICLDFKNDDKLNAIEKAQHIEMDFSLSKKDEGLFIVHPHPDDSQGRGSPVDRFLLRMWERGNVGLFVDECFVLGDSPALATVLTQGRSIHVPAILCTQRPSWISRYAFSEADFFQVFSLNDVRDKQSVEKFTPIEQEDFDRLEKFQSFYYNVADDDLVKFAPVPKFDDILATLDAKLPRKRVRI